MADGRGDGMPDHEGELDEAVLADGANEDLAGSGGASGGGTVAGAGEPSGGTIDAGAGPGVSAVDPESGAIAAEASALGSADGSLADQATSGATGAERSSAGPTGAEAIGAGARRGDTGSGTPGDSSGLGGGGSLGQHGGTGPEGAARPGGNKGG